MAIVASDNLVFIPVGFGAIDRRAAEWISDVITTNHSVPMLCISLNAWLPAGLEGQLIYHTVDGLIAQETFVQLSADSPWINGVYEVSMPSNVTQYQVVIYCNVADVMAGQDVGFIKSVVVIEGRCSTNGQLQTSFQNMIHGRINVANIITHLQENL